MKTIFALVALGCVALVAGHGRLISPPARNCMWRYGFKNPINYNDDEQYCGSFGTQWGKNKGKCGICGDPYHWKNKPHEDGGRYGNGIIGKVYKKGETIEVEVELTTSHQGWFEFRIGDYEFGKVEHIGNGMLKGHLLKTPGGSPRFYLPKNSGAGFYKTKLVLPADLTCNRCVMQWWYKTANSWGCVNGDWNGKCGMGYGPQECFVNCADVKIVG